MKTASQVIGPDDRAKIEAAIASAETKTSAEVVVIVATRSGLYDRAEDLVGLVLGLLAVAVPALLVRDAPAPGQWRVQPGIALGLGTVLLLFTLGCILGAALATRFPILARPFITRRAMLLNVQQRGAELFQRHRLASTAGRTGVLIYISLLERMCWVVGDDVAALHLPEDALGPVRDEVAGAFRAGQPVPGLVAAVGRLGDLLAAKLPAPPGMNPDEVPNTLLVLD